jgi:uroporphyrinogen decarboxylase
MSTRKWEPLPREEVIKAVERKNPCRIPLVHAKWWGEGLVDQYGDRLKEFDRVPDDVANLHLSAVEPKNMGLSWTVHEKGAKDSSVIIDDWAKLDEFIEKMTDPMKDEKFLHLIGKAERARADDRYISFGWWRLFFEKPWQLRGMENLMIDYYENPEMVHKMHDALCNQYIRYLTAAVREIRPDGFWCSDDLGHQTAPMMSPAIFDELIKPYYDRIGEFLHKNNIHWWLHSCGCNTPLLPSLIDAGLDVFHPVQKGTMDEIEVAREFGDRLTFLAGIDVQHTLQEKGPEDVREEVRFLIDTFDRPDGGLCLAAGNGIVRGTPLENIAAFLDEALVYGKKHRQMVAA